jgi:hypothetical protein
MTKYAPKEACRKFCTQCIGLKRFDSAEITGCQGDQAANGDCPLFPFRLGNRISVKIFRHHCMYCMGQSRALVSDCETTDCELWPYRMGKNPALTGIRKGVNPFVARGK